MSEKPLTEVLAKLYVAERYKLDPETTPWANMSDQAQALELGAMAEVVRALDLFGWDVFNDDGRIGVRAKVEKPPRMKTKPEDMPDRFDPMALGAPESTDETVSTAQFKGFTGIPCDACGSLNTVRNGKCLLCMDCHASGECG